MLAEFLSKQGEWTQVMPGARACLFSLCERSFPLPLRLEPLHFEVLFCLAGMVTLTRRDGSVLRLGTLQVLLLTDISDLTDARVETGLKGVLVAVDARGARASLKAICDLLGGLALNTDQVRRWMVSRGGCAVEGPSRWSQAAFADLDRLPQSERARWCVWKSVELLYLLSAQGEPAAEMVPVLDQEAAKYLVSCGLKGVGTDAFGVDRLASGDLAAHKILLRGGLVILENLCLKKVVGRTDFMLMALPLKYQHADGAPVRAVAQLGGDVFEKEMEQA